MDGSHAALRAVRWAAAVAVRLGAPLHLVHARPSLGHTLSDAAADIRAIEMEVERESATATLAAATRTAEAESSDLVITTTDIDRPADVTLTDLSKTALLVVLGSDEILLGPAMLIGSTTIAVATHSTCPVVAFRGDMPTPTGQPIMVGIDHDHDAQVAVTAAFELAHRLGVEVIAVHTWMRRRPAGEVALPFMIDWDELEHDERTHLSERLAPLIGLYPDVGVTEVVDLDKPSRALIRRGEDAQLVVVGSRGRGLLAGAFLGSTGLNLLHHSAIPVMICRSAHPDHEARKGMPT
ncbi:nucleotide-binding universal stress UspA family protein [Mycobacterium sp. OAS707]|nr:nucleotide-binding universal stress UspA family protein [Mycobacterium sp. OAS707]